MSIRLMSRVFELNLPAMEKFVLLAMADHARDDGTRCYPSVDTLARKTSLSTRGVQKLIRRLQSRRLLASKGNAKGGRGLTVEYHITIEKGERGSGFRKKEGERGCSKRVNVSAEKGEPGSPEPSGTIREPVAARGVGAKYIEGDDQGELCRSENRVRVRQPNPLLTGPKTRELPAWVKGALAEDLYRGIYGKRIADVFFDARTLRPQDQLAACVNAAVTTLVVARVARLKTLRADEIEKRAVARLRGGLAALVEIKNFETRRRHTVNAVTAAVIGTCMEMLQDDDGAGKEP